MSSLFEGVCLELTSSWPLARVFRGLCTTPRVAFPGDPLDPGACSFFFILGVKIGTCAFGWFEKSKKHYQNCIFSESLFQFCNKNRYLRSRPMRTDRKTQCVFVKIDENRCTVTQNRVFFRKSMKIVVLSFKIVQNRWKSLSCRSK